MADTKCSNIELQNHSYATLQISKQEESLYASTPDHIYESPQDWNERPAVSSLVPELESKEVVSSNIQHVTNSVGNYSIQKERVKRSILLILLIASTLLNVVILITLFTTQVTCPQVNNTTEMVQSIVQEVLSLRSQEILERPSNASEETLLQLINMSYDNIDLLKTQIESSQQQLVRNITALLVNISNNNIQLLTTHIESSEALQQQQLTLIDNNTQLLEMQMTYAQASQLQLSQNITALLEMVDDNSQLVEDHIDSTQSSQQLLVRNITALLVNISNNNIQLLTTHIESSEALQQQQLTLIDNNTQLLEMQMTYAQASQLQLSQNITALLEMVDDNSQLVEDHIDSTQSSQQLLVRNITALLVNISNNNIQLLTTHIESSEALQQQQLTLIDNNTQLLEMQMTYAQASQLQLSQNITALLEMVDDNSQLVEDHIDSTQSSQQLLVRNITALLVNISNNNIQLLTTHIESSEALQQQQLTLIDNNTQLLEMQMTYAQASQLQLSQNITALLEMVDDNSQLVEDHIDSTQSSQQLLVRNITALLVNISNNNIQLLTTHIESSEALQQQQLTLIDNNTQLLEMQMTYAQASQLQLSQNITALLEMVDDNSQLVEDHIDSTQSSQQLLVHNITALLVNISNNNIQLLTTHIESSEALQQQQLTLIDNNTQLLEMQMTYAQASQLQLSQNITALLEMVDDNSQLVEDHIDSTQSSLQLLVHNITALLVNISNNTNIVKLLTTHIESSEALQQQQLTLIDNNTQLLEMQTTYAQASQLQLSQNITALLEMVDGNSQLVKDHIDSTQSSQQLLVHNITALLDMVNDNGLSLDVTNKNVTSSLQKLNNIINTQSIIEDISVENKGTINNILVKVDDVLEILNSSLVSSCQDIKNKQPNSPSGYYHINSQIVYCEMGELCNTGGGWARLAYLDMTDSTVDCPPGFKLYKSGGVRACGRSSDNAPGCQSVKFLSNGISYSEVCGRVVGYQYGSPNALHGPTNIDYYYVDGVSITQGHPRKHVWTLTAGLFESHNVAAFNCPCNTPPGNNQPPSFVGNDYFCESGNPNNQWSNILYSNDPLWDGEGCGTQEGNCCAASGLPWFHKTFISTSEYLELRVCGNEPITNEDTPISFYELYVK